ncbi:flagellar hook-length control protein FliK [Pseudomonas sp. HR96]|uniref:flagellar hook-length control protein FliK n=1 Tax=Pseudomonas sp. HR96 TaxID=1027966 RepID=UPI002A74FFEB|nr:flagellar hook-length control protein FliK [Pseudomonas sp. HR96]WPP01320.1 flagellar hook-length control protein FliK [Pseudomonas sp. HR96]
MSLASNPLLQLTSVTTTPVTSTSPASKVLDANSDAASSFAELYAKHSQQAQAQADSSAARNADKAAAVRHDVPAAKDKTVADKPAVADSGKNLPAKASTVARADRNGTAGKSDKVAKADKPDASDPADKTSAASGSDASDATDKVAQAGDQDDDQASAASDAAPTDPSLLAAATPPEVKPEPAPAAVDASAQAPQAPQMLDPAVVASMMPAAATTPPPASATDSKASSEDPAPDALADLPAVRLALEQNAKAQGTTSAHAKTDDAAPGNANASTDASLVNGLAAQVVTQQGSDADAGKGGDKDFKSLLDDGLKDVKGASADTRMDNFANRLQNLTDATTAKTANAAPLSTALAMNQGGWSEGLVNRVMYLSSQNLKSADIQLSPAELGTLNIRVDMAPDQQTQVTFVSAHIGVRDALESQQGRLKEMFAQQGLGQMDVNVSDQSRNQQGQQQQADQASRAANSSRGGSSSDSGGVEGIDSSAGAAAAVAQSVVIGSSAVDYYA